MSDARVAEKECDCVFCKHHHDFNISDDLLDEFLHGKVVLFVGAGVSTESRQVLYFTFYDDIAGELGYENYTKPFSDVMEEYCDKVNGRRKLLEKIKDRINHIKSFPELYLTATRFHQELSTFYPIDTIVTTNWDTYFEDECGATPFITAEDLSFWDTAGRKVIKIHGSVSNYGSIVATTSDYKSCLERLHSGVLGSVLKTILATKTIVYVGYSFSDEDFLHINSVVKEEMKGLHKQAYIVTLDDKNDDKYKNEGLIPIYTDGTYFISQIKRHAISKEIMFPDEIYDVARIMKKIVLIEHEKLHEKYNCYDNPEVTICASYQDGLIHGFEKIYTMRSSGMFSHHCVYTGLFKRYDKLRKEKLREMRYEDVSYIDGYVNAFTYILVKVIEKEKDAVMPLFYAFGSDHDLVTFEDYADVVPDIPELHKAAYKRAKNLVAKQTPHGTPVEFHHVPWL